MKARALGIKTKGVRKNDLIREIKKKGGKFRLLRYGERLLRPWNCCFREDCLTSVRNFKRLLGETAMHIIKNADRPLFLCQ